jgi:hypothetical protein
VPGKHPCRGCIRSTESEDAAALTPKAYYNGPAKQGQQPCPQQHNCGGGSLAADPQSGTSMSRQHQRLGSKHSPPPAATGLPVAVSQPATCPPGYQSAAQHDIISVKVGEHSMVMHRFVQGRAPPRDICKCAWSCVHLPVSLNIPATRNHCRKPLRCSVGTACCRSTFQHAALKQQPLPSSKQSLHAWQQRPMASRRRRPACV